MENFALSVNNIPVRLPSERWEHIVENHNDMAGYYYDVLEAVTTPTWIVEGDGKDEFWAVKLISDRKAFLVIYKESKANSDGFVITAFITTKIKKLLKRRIIWQQQQPK